MIKTQVMVGNERYSKSTCLNVNHISGEHHSQQTDTRTENEIPHVLTHRRVLNNENTWTLGEEHHTLGSVGGK